MSQDQADLVRGGWPGTASLIARPPHAAAPPPVRGDCDVDLVERWVVWAQDGHATSVLAQTSAQVLASLAPARRARALYARSLAFVMVDDVVSATSQAVELSAFCWDHALAEQGLLARAWLVELLRRQGRLEEAVEELARAVASEPALEDVGDERTQAALGALAVALRTFGMPQEARRVEDRLSGVEASLPLHQRVSRWSNLAIEQAISAMAACRVPPFAPDRAMLASAATQIRRAVELAEDGSYAVVRDEAAVLDALALAVGDDPAAALVALQSCREVLQRGAEAVPARLLWAAACVRALVSVGRRPEAVEQGRRLLEAIAGSGEAGDRMVLAYEVLRAEYPDVETAGSGAAEAVAIGRVQAQDDAALLRALFRSRVDLWREADQRLSLARKASLDSLTGLLNRRGAATVLATACNRPPGEPVALLLLDLDDFRTVNDTCGHMAGDVVLQHVARNLRAAIGDGEVVARWGGDTFLVIAYRGGAQALALAEQLRARVREASDPGSAESVTASVGVCVRREPVEEQDLVARAELALFAAKRSGGDSVVLK